MRQETSKKDIDLNVLLKLLAFDRDQRDQQNI